MSVSVLPNSGFNFALLNQGITAARPNSADRTADPGSGDFAAALTLRLADLRSQSFDALIDSDFRADKASDTTSLGALLFSRNAPTAPPALANGNSVSGLSATGRNSALFDPESAYKMMTVINKADVTWKAQFAELSEMKSYLAEMRQDGQRLGRIDAATDSDDIKSQLQIFAGQYNDWVRRFDPDMESGGVLAGTQAAQVSRVELEQSVEDIFNGAAAGLHGLRDLGFTIDPVSGLATLDTARLDSILASNKQGAVDTLREFGTHFARAAELLNSDGNFIPNRLGNLSRVIDYITDHKPALQAEFGLGDAARPSGEIARALSTYNRIYAT